VKEPSAVVKPGQKVQVTVTEIDLPRNRIALSMRSNPTLGPKTANSGSPGGQRSPGGGPRPGGNAAPAAPRAPAAVNNDWFAAALNKKR
jgi:uncharacterized protein